MTNETSNARYLVTYTCTCGEVHEEHFLTNDKSRSALLSLVAMVVLSDIDDVNITRIDSNGETDETIAVLAALVFMSL